MTPSCTCRWGRNESINNWRASLPFGGGAASNGSGGGVGGGGGGGGGGGVYSQNSQGNNINCSQASTQVRGGGKKREGCPSEFRYRYRYQFIDIMNKHSTFQDGLASGRRSPSLLQNSMTQRNSQNSGPSDYGSLIAAPSSGHPGAAGSHQQQPRQQHHQQQQQQQGLASISTSIQELNVLHRDSL